MKDIASVFCNSASDFPSLIQLCLHSASGFMLWFLNKQHKMAFSHELYIYMCFFVSVCILESCVLPLDEGSESLNYIK